MQPPSLSRENKSEKRPTTSNERHAAPSPPRFRLWLSSCSLEHFIYAAVTLPLALVLIHFIFSSFLTKHHEQAPAPQESPVDSELFRYPKSFLKDYEQMEKEFKVYKYPDGDPGTYYDSPGVLKGRYASESYFFKNIKKSHFLTSDPSEAHLFFVPISARKLRSEGATHENVTIIVRNYFQRLASKYPYWNRKLGSDHFFVACHKTGVKLTEGLPHCSHNLIRIACSPSRDRTFRDIVIPSAEQNVSIERTRLDSLRRAAESMQNPWEHESDYIFPDNVVVTPEGYLLCREEGYHTPLCVCLHGLPAHTSLIEDSIRYGCVPVILTNNPLLPFNDILDWSKFSVIRKSNGVRWFKDIFVEVSEEGLSRLQENLVKVQKHFKWNFPPVRFDAFNLAMFELWRRH